MLNIYIEKEFLDVFYKEYNEDKPSKVQTIVYKMLVDYPESKWFLDCDSDSAEEFEILKNENPIIAAKAANNYGPLMVKSIKEEVFKQTDNKTSIVFMSKEQDWFGEAEKQGILCYSSKNYENKILEIIDTYHYKIDLSEKDFNWSKLKIISTFNNIKINDNYILVDKDNMKIDKNISSLLKKAISDNYRIANVEIFTKEFLPKRLEMTMRIEDAAKRKKEIIEGLLSDYKHVKFKIINNSVRTVALNFHDRMIITNFQIVDSGMGFNLIPHKASNSQIVSETIFEIYSYKRIKNLVSTHDEYFKKITGDNFQTSEFTYL